MLPELLDKDALDVIAYNGASDEEQVELQPGQVPGNGETSAQDGQPEVSLIGEGGASVAPETAMDLEAIPEGDQLRQQSSSSLPAPHANAGVLSWTYEETRESSTSWTSQSSSNWWTSCAWTKDQGSKNRSENGLQRRGYDYGRRWIGGDVGFMSHGLREWQGCLNELQKGEDEGPPDITPEQLAELDGAAALDEVRTSWPECDISSDTWEIDFYQPGGHYMVYRDDRWKRRCRIVAREYREGQTNEEQYSPTSTFAAVRALLTLGMLYDLHITSMDVKDAFLLVDQREEMFVVIPLDTRDGARRCNSLAPTWAA